MKTPRVNDFDPKAKSPELKSSMKGMPAIAKPVSQAGEVNSDSMPPYPVPYPL